MCSFRRFTVGCASLLLFAPHAVAAQYGFVNIADTRGPFEGFGFTSQAVSDTGTVAFIGNQGGVDRTYVGNGGAVQQVVSNLDAPLPAGFSYLDTPGLNASGVAARMASKCCGPYDAIINLFEASGTSTIAYGTSGSATVVVFFTRPAISNGGAVVFGTRIVDFTSPPTTNQAHITRWFSGTSTTLVGTTEGFNSVGSVALNELGDVAFSGYRQGEGLTYYRTDGATRTYIAGPFDNEAGAIAINDSGTVAFGRFPYSGGGGEGIFVGDGGPVATVAVADATTPFSELETDIDINNQGTVAFTARLWNGSYGIYAGGDPASDKVVEIGDFLFGQRVSGLGRPHLNNRGDIAFWFSVLDPREPSGEWTGIALAVKESALMGDYNGNGTVGPEDYNVWKANFGSTTLLAADGNGDGRVNASDYTVWRNNLGATLTGDGSAGASPSHAAAPEPSSFAILIAGAVVAAARLMRRRTR